MDPIQKIYDDCLTARTSMARALERDQADREPLSPKTQRTEVLDLMRYMLDSAKAQQREFSPQESDDWGELESRADALDKEVAIHQRKLDTEARVVWGAQRAVDSSWRTASGEPVRVLAPDEQMSDVVGHHRPPAIGLGAALRAMALGTGNTDVRAALTEGSDSGGGFTVPTDLLRQIIDLMRAKTVTVRAGAMTVELGTDKTSIARLASDPIAAWRMENAAVAESDPTFESVDFTARSLAVLVKMSRELLEDSVNLESAVMNALAGAMAVETDRVALFGSGTAPEPLGVYNTSGIGEVDMGTDGAALTSFDEHIDLIQSLADANAAAPSAFVMAPRTAAALAKLKDANNQPLQAPATVAAVPRLTTTIVPIDQSHGTASDASAVIAGDFSQMMLGVRSQLRIELLRETFAKNLQFAFLAHLRMDVQLAHPQSFARLVGIIPA